MNLCIIKCLNVTVFNSQIKLKSELKKDIEVTLKPSSNVIGDLNDGINFRNKVLLADRQVQGFLKLF